MALKMIEDLQLEALGGMERARYDGQKGRGEKTPHSKGTDLLSGERETKARTARARRDTRKRIYWGQQSRLWRTFKSTTGTKKRKRDGRSKKDSNIWERFGEGAKKAIKKTLDKVRYDQATNPPPNDGVARKRKRENWGR